MKARQQNNGGKKIFLFLQLQLITAAVCCQYSVTEIITDYNGYWKSAATAINTVKPGNSHNLVAFSFNGSRYSTGVNDALLSSKGQSFIAGDYRALPLTSISGTVSSNTKIGLGNMYDGVDNGPGATAPANNMPLYLTDGIKGLDLGTCVANLPAGTQFFPVNKILTPSINDGIPDIVITQTADPSGSMDRYEFADIHGNRVGNYVDIVLANIAPVGNWTADFYEASKTPMTLAGCFTKTDRPVRLWASDLNAFGINSSNAGSIAYFRIVMSGNSDVAFVAYNNNSINLDQKLLPLTLNDFSGRQINQQVRLQWTSSNAVNSASFIIEKSSNGTSFSAIDKMTAVNGIAALNYTYTDKNPVAGNNYYRLKMVDQDGRFDYSAVIVVNIPVTAAVSIHLYPNPAKTFINISHPFAGNNERVQISNLQGRVLLQQKITAASFQTRIDLPALPAGIYQLVWTNGENINTQQLVVQ